MAHNKKIIIFFILALMIFSSLIKPTQAANCTWNLNGLPNANDPNDNQNFCQKSGLRAGNILTECDASAKPTVINQKPVCCCGITDSLIQPATAKPSATSSLSALLNPLENLEVKIPGLNTSTQVATCTTLDGNTSCSIPWISVYIKGIFNYSMGIIGLLAAIALMIGGVIWIVAGGNASRISEAKSWIGASITGLIIGLTSFILLNEINPDLVGFRPVNLTMIKYEPTSFASKPDTTGSITPESYCPKSGGINELDKIISSLQGKVAYRWGGYGQRGPFTKEGSPSPHFYDPCPDGITCLDCAGFAGYALGCAGINGGITHFGPAFHAATYPCKQTLNDAAIKQLKKGDVIGWSTHVLLVIKDYSPGNSTITTAETWGNMTDGQALLSPSNNPIVKGQLQYKYDGEIITDVMKLDCFNK